jgi:rhodanese-related sulfurtransferase
MSSNGEIDVEQFASANPSGTVGDVREAAEFASGHVPGAGLIQTGQLAARMHDLDRMGPVYVICATGNHSRAMTDLLRGAGFDAYSVAGGNVPWARSGRTVKGGLV